MKTRVSLVSNSSSASFVIAKDKMGEADVRQMLLKNLGDGYFCLMNDETGKEIQEDERCINNWWLSTQIMDHPEYQAAYRIWRYLRSVNIPVEANGDGIGGWPADFDEIEQSMVDFFYVSILLKDENWCTGDGLKAAIINLEVESWLNDLSEQEEWDNELLEFNLTKDIVKIVTERFKEGMNGHK